VLKTTGVTSAGNNRATLMNLFINSSTATAYDIVDVNMPSVLINWVASSNESPDVVRSMNFPNGFVALNGLDGDIDTITTTTDRGIRVTRDGVYTKNRTIAEGHWTSVTFASGNFTASGSLTWTVESADQVVLAFTLIGQTMTISFIIDNTSTGGSASNTLKIAIPASKTATGRVEVVCFTDDAGGGLSAGGIVLVTAGGTTIDIFKDATGANWSNAAVNNTDVRGQITFDVE